MNYGFGLRAHPSKLTSGYARFESVPQPSVTPFGEESTYSVIELHLFEHLPLLVTPARNENTNCEVSPVTGESRGSSGANSEAIWGWVVVLNPKRRAGARGASNE